MSKVQLRTFSGAPDLRAMAALARAFPRDNLHAVDLPYRFSSWALDDPANVALWVDEEGRLLAWAVMQTPFWTIDYALHPRADRAFPQILAWADGRASLLCGTAHGLPQWYVNVFADQAERIRDLEAAGFAAQTDVGEDPWSRVLLQRSARGPVADCPLPPGFTIRPLRGGAEVEAYVQLHRAVFGSKNMTAEWRRRTLRRPERAADLVAVASDGRLAAFCIGWLDAAAEPARAQVEPLGVHEEWRGLGLGRAILSAGLRQLQRHGAEQVLVETDRYRDAALGLYGAAGFRVQRDVLVYRKDYGPGQEGQACP